MATPVKGSKDGKPGFLIHENYTIDLRISPKFPDRYLDNGQKPDTKAAEGKLLSFYQSFYCVILGIAGIAKNRGMIIAVTKKSEIVRAGAHHIEVSVLSC
jgi:hypothetical protein